MSGLAGEGAYALVELEASGMKPSASMMPGTHWRVSARTRSEPRSTRDTVAVEMPTMRATPWMVVTDVLMSAVT